MGGKSNTFEELIESLTEQFQLMNAIEDHSEESIIVG